MSISKAREVFEKPGCAISAGVFLAFIMGISMFGTCAPNPNQVQQSQQSAGPSVLKVGSTEISAAVFEAATERAIREQQASLQEQAGRFAAIDGFSLTDRILIRASTYNQLAEGSLVLSVAEDLGIKLDDATIAATLKSMLEKSIVQLRAQYVADKKLKPNATDAEFDQVFKGQVGQTLAEARTRQENEIKSNLAQPLGRYQLQVTAANQLVMERLGKDVVPTAADVEASFDTIRLKAIEFGPKPGLTGTPTELATKAKAEIEKGEKFETVFARYSVAKGPDGKDAKLTETPFPRSVLDTIQELRSLTTLKPGMVSTPISFSGRTQIFQVAGIDRNLPADFKERSGFYREQFINQKAQARLRDKIEEKKKANIIVWKDAGVDALIQSVNLLNSLSPDAETSKKRVQEQLAKVEGVTASGDVMAFAGAKYLLIDRLWGLTKPTDRATLRPQYLSAINDLLKNQESPQLRLMLVEQLAEMKDPKAGEALLLASQANATFGPMAQSMNAQIFSYVDRLKKDKLITADQEQAINEAQQRWMTQKKDYDTALAKAKADEEAAQKRMEEERKKLEEERKKAQSGAPKTDVPSGSSLMQPQSAPPAASGN